MFTTIECVKCGGDVKVESCQIDAHGDITVLLSPCKQCVKEAKQEGYGKGFLHGSCPPLPPRTRQRERDKDSKSEPVAAYYGVRDKEGRWWNRDTLLAKNPYLLDHATAAQEIINQQTYGFVTCMKPKIIAFDKDRQEIVGADETVWRG